MKRKPYKTSQKFPATVNEPATAYQKMDSAILSSNNWNPNVPFIGTQEEWRDHFHRIEEGTFYTWEESNKEFEEWKMKLLASRI